MRKKTIKHNVYTFDELSEEVQDEVIEKWATDMSEMMEMFIDDDYHWEELKEAGLDFDIKGVCLDIDRQPNLYFARDHSANQKRKPQTLWIENQERFMEKVQEGNNGNQVQEVLKDIENVEVIAGVEYYGGDGRNYIEIYRNGSNIVMETLQEAEEQATAVLEELLDDCLQKIKKTYEDATSRESIVEDIERNGVEFLSNGRVF